MLRQIALSLFLSLPLAPALLAQNNTCGLQLAMVCASGTCTTTTTNGGSAPCSGEFIIGFVTADMTVTLGSVTNSLGLTQCATSASLPGQTEAYSICVGQSSLAAGASFTASASVSGTSTVPLLGITEVFAGSSTGMIGFAYATQGGSTAPTCVPVPSLPAQTQSGIAYNLTWTSVIDTSATYLVDESTAADFSANTTTQSVSGTSLTFRHNATSATSYFYRVRAASCSGNPGQNSSTVSIVVEPPQAFSSSSGHADVSVPLGSTDPFHFSVTVTNAAAGTGFTATADQPFITVSPSNGTIPMGGGLSLDVTVNPAGLPAGTNSATINVNNSSNGTSITHLKASTNVSVPFASAGKTLPPSNALIIPVVAHVTGFSAPFQSDVRITNVTGAAVTYQITFTPAQTDGTKNGKMVTLTLQSGQTLALDDILKNQFGYGAGGANENTASGSLEIRPLNSSSPLTFASSRTYATTSSGTYGQFVPAIPFSQFATFSNLLPFGAPPPSSPPILTMQQIAQSAKFRTNLGLVEGSGTPASGTIRILDDSGNVLKSVPFSLQAGEQVQLGNFLSANGVGELDDGRVEVEVDSQSGGAVTTYASVVDNTTSDPLAVSPVQTAQIRETTYVVPGIADLTGLTNFHSDLRLFNGGTSAVTVHPTFYPQGGGAAVPIASLTINAGETKAFDNILPSLFHVTGTGGSVVFTTDGSSSLVATARTYTIASGGGTYGQFIPGVTSDQGTGAGGRPLQILQLEESLDFRSNIGLAEITGNAVHGNLTVVTPDSKVAATLPFDLPPFGFLQYGSLIGKIYPGHTVYNARVIVEVTSGTGRVSAYGSVLDNTSNDPTYVPAQ